MKKILFIGLLSFIFLSSTNAQYRTERTGYEGDFFSLEGAIELFKESHSLKDFERKLNSKHTYVNNLDLDYNGRIDFIRVRHRRQGNFHVIILQVPIDRRDLQDVAVIEIEKIGRRDAVLQIIGDPDLYGEEVIVEPFETRGYSSSRGNSNASYVSNDYVNVYYWPVVQYILAPRYIVYSSPYHWNYYPSWWSPWHPYSWYVYHPRIRHYHRHCHVVTIYRSPRVHRFYKPHRSYSHHVAKRTAKVRVQRGNANVHRSSVRKNTSHSRYGSGDRKVSQSKKVTTYRKPQRKVSTGNQMATRVNKSRQINNAQKQQAKVNSKRTTGATRSQPRVISKDQTQKRTTTRTQSASPRITKRPSATPPSRRTSEYQKKPSQTRDRVSSGTRTQTRTNNATRKVIAPRQRAETNKQRTMPTRAQSQINKSGQSRQRSYSSGARSMSNVKKSTQSHTVQRQRSSAASRKATPSRTRKK